MSIYTYHIHKSLCEILEVEYKEISSLSDQVLDERPYDLKNIGPAFPIFYGENHPHYGKPRPDDVRMKISNSRKGQSLSPWTEERRSKTKATLSGRKLSPEHVEKMRQNRIGTKHSEETKAKMRESQMRRRLKEKLDITCKP